MRSLSDEMNRLFFVLDPPTETESCVVVQFIGAVSGEGVSTIAREFATIAARNVKGETLLLDLSTETDSQYLTFQDEEQAARFGYPDPDDAVDVGDEIIRRVWQASGEHESQLSDATSSSFHRVGETGLYVSRTDTTVFPSRKVMRLNQATEFWDGLKSAFSMIVIDSPALSENFDGLAVCKFSDASILVISAEKTRRPVALNLRDKVLDHDGHIAGVVFNRRKMHIPRFIYKLL